MNREPPSFAGTPEFETLNWTLIASIFSVFFVTLLLFMALSWRSFDHKNTGRLTPRIIGAMFWRGKLPGAAFYAVAALHFALAAGYITWLEGFVYVRGGSGLAAYNQSEKDPESIALSNIKACDWRDRYEYSYLDDNWDVRFLAPAKVAADVVDPKVSDFRSFYNSIVEKFRGQAPTAISRVSDGLNPIFLLLSGLFLLATRGLFKRDADDKFFRTPDLVAIALLAYALVYLGYFVVLRYTSEVEISRALAAGRIVCIDHIRAFYIAQSRSLTAAGIVLFVLVALFPRPIFRNI